MGALSRLPYALAESTNKAYTAMFRLYLAFLAFVAFTPNQVNVDIFLAFLECLVVNQVKAAQLQNYVSAIKNFSIRFSMPSHFCDHPKVHMYIKSLQKSAPVNVKINQIIDIQLLKALITCCDRTFLGDIFKTCYLLAFFTFLRLSNLVPHTVHSFNVVKHLTKGDIFFARDHATVLIKWTKTLQFANQARMIKIPMLNNIICPVAALKKCLKITPGDKNSPLFQYKTASTWLPLTDTRVRKHLQNVLKLLNLHENHVTFHSFRRSGATFAFNHNVSLQEIQRHGTWTSDCVWRYITEHTDAGSEVARNFALHLAS